MTKYQKWMMMQCFNPRTRVGCDLKHGISLRGFDEKIVVNYRLTQAKMSYNRQVSSDPLLNEVVVAWANAHDIPINTIDVNAYGE